MPEEKKDSFTFSDKIKNSKTAASPSFANRVSSKIGSNGRPKKTLFERTKRDAPFFIAALVALLLLPFLYKYSGQVNEEPVIAPSSEDTVFDPERYGFDTAVTDPDGQIAQLSARDPLSLIKGFGSGEEDSSSAMYDYDRSGLADTSTSYTSTGPTTDTTTNIYRRKAAPATRAAFRRSATKIKEMGRAPMASAGGGLNVTPWGGSLKGAAKKVGADAPRTPPKPVSLQPLQAAGRPARGYFGQGGAEQARRSKDALTKGNAMQALRDAQFTPVETGRIGGLTGATGALGGGASDLKHGFGYNGITPWWWDLMKTRSQMEWEKRFNRKWNWIEWGDKLAQNFLDPFLSCLITGTDDWSMGMMWGAKTGAGSPAKCGDLDAKGWESCTKCLEYGPFNKNNCKNYLSSLNPDSTMVKKGWQGGNVAGSNMNALQVRLDCMGNGFFAGKGASDADIMSANGSGKAACKDFEINKVYAMKLAGSAKGWNGYHFVVARNNSPFGNGKRLCGFDSSRQYTKTTSSGVEDVVPQVSLEEGYRLLSVYKGAWSEMEKAKKSEPAYKRNRVTLKVNGKDYTSSELKREVDILEHSLEKARLSGETTVGNNFAKRPAQNGRVQGRYSYEDINANAGEDGNNLVGEDGRDTEINYHDCVIYLAAGQEFEYRKFKEETILLLAQMMGSKANTFYELEKNPGYGVAYAKAKEAFGRLDLRYIRGLATKKPLAVTGKVSKNDAKLPAMPMVYFDFDRSYIQRVKGRSSGREKDLDKVFTRKERDENAYILATPCVFTDLAIGGKKIENNSPEATLTIPGTKKFPEYEVTAIINYEAADRVYKVNVPEDEITALTDTEKAVGGNRLQDYRIKDARKLLMAQYPELVENGKLKDGFDLSGATGKVKAIVDWKAVEKSSQRTAADEVPVEADKVTPPVPAAVNIDVKTGGDLANYSCSNRDQFYTFVNKKSNRQTIDEAYQNNPIWCRECQDTAKKVLAQVIEESNKVIAQNKQSTEQLTKSNVPLSDPKYNQLETATKRAEQAAATAQSILDRQKTRGQWWLTIHDYLVVLDYMSQQDNTKTLPVTSVCYLGRSIAEMSADPSVPERSELNNVFGTFAVYVGMDSYLFPMQTVKLDGKCMDPRFTGEDKSKSCVPVPPAGKKKVYPPYHWGYYDHSFWDSGDVSGTDDTKYYPPAFQGYTDFLAEKGIGPEYYPLEAMQLNYPSRSIALGLPSSRLSSHGKQNNDRFAQKKQTSGYNDWSGGKYDSKGGTATWRNAYHNVYNRPFYDTNGCEVYQGKTMDVTAVLQYLNLVCANGLNFKPQTGYKENDMGVDLRNYTGDVSQGTAGQRVAN